MYKHLLHYLRRFHEPRSLYYCLLQKRDLPPRHHAVPLEEIRTLAKISVLTEQQAADIFRYNDRHVLSPTAPCTLSPPAPTLTGTVITFMLEYWGIAGLTRLTALKVEPVLDRFIFKQLEETDDQAALINDDEFHSSIEVLCVMTAYHHYYQPLYNRYPMFFGNCQRMTVEVIVETLVERPGGPRRQDLIDVVVNLLTEKDVT